MGEVTEVALHSKMWTACLKDYNVCMSRPVVNQLRRGLLSIVDNKRCVEPKYPLVCVCVQFICPPTLGLSKEKGFWMYPKGTKRSMCSFVALLLWSRGKSLCRLIEKLHGLTVTQLSMR